MSLLLNYTGASFQKITLRAQNTVHILKLIRDLLKLNLNKANLTLIRLMLIVGRPKIFSTYVHYEIISQLAQCLI